MTTKRGTEMGPFSKMHFGDDDDGDDDNDDHDIQPMTMMI